jgi:hypothetical protein
MRYSGQIGDNTCKYQIAKFDFRVEISERRSVVADNLSRILLRISKYTSTCNYLLTRSTIEDQKFPILGEDRFPIINVAVSDGILDTSLNG